ncbi:hypothetical protein PI126_g18641 [Phytophthora idaei]|nr:hypothetical protein PI126_g18641 [Phytophthora idaei]
MANIMDFNSVWPLLRKEGWTWKPATGIQIHHNYLKPGRKIRGGKRGTDYFNGEDERLAYALRDTNLCTRQNIANVWVRPPSQAMFVDAANVDVDGPADPDINGDGSSDEASSSGGEGSVCHFDGSDNDDPDSEDEVEVRRDDDRVVLPRAADSVSEFQAIGRTGMEPSDPNLVLGTDEEFLDSDAEGSDDLVETAEGFVDDASSEAGDTNKSIAQEVSRMVSLMKRSEAAELHLRVQGSSDIYHNNQLTDMANDGWDVLPDDTTADVTDDAGADKMYDGYCGPSQGIIVAAKSPIELFFYLLPKALWRHIASESNRC